MKNRCLVIIVTVLIMLGIGGCNNIEQSPPGSSETPFSPTASNQSPMNAFQSVLQNKAQFFSTDIKKDLKITQLNQVISDDSSVETRVTKFAIVDLNKDDISEVILWLAVQNDDAFGFEVMRYQDGVIYGYTLSYRSFMDLKDDGTFSFSSGAADSGYGTVKFTEKGYTIDKISYSESSYDSKNNQSISYYVNHESATEEEFLMAISKQSEKTEVTWYDFTDDNIETMLSKI